MTAIAEYSDVMCKEVECIDMAESEPDESNGENRERSPNAWQPRYESIIAQETGEALSTRISDSESGHYFSLHEQKFQDLLKTIDSLVVPYPDSSSPGATLTSMTGSDRLKMTSSRSSRANLTTGSPDFEMPEQSESTPPTVLEKTFTERPEGVFQRKHWKIPPVIYGANNETLSRNDSLSSDSGSFIDENHETNDKNTQGDVDIPTLGSFVAGLKEMAKLRYGNQFNQSMNKVEEIGNKAETNARDATFEPAQDWSLKFEKLQKLIVELWHACNVPLVHRTYFILLIKDDFTDSIYMEVEHRRLSFLMETFSQGNSAVHDGRTLTLASSKKALRLEREMLSRLMHKRCTEDERRMYNDWSISVYSKQRKLQLVHLFWSDTANVDHITKSAAIIAKLIGFSQHGQAHKEMFGLSFTPPPMIRRSFSWKNSLVSLLWWIVAIVLQFQKLQVALHINSPNSTGVMTEFFHVSDKLMSFFHEFSSVCSGSVPDVHVLENVSTVLA